MICGTWHFKRRIFFLPRALCQLIIWAANYSFIRVITYNDLHFLQYKAFTACGMFSIKDFFFTIEIVFNRCEIKWGLCLNNNRTKNVNIFIQCRLVQCIKDFIIMTFLDSLKAHINVLFSFYLKTLILVTLRSWNTTLCGFICCDDATSKRYKIYI